MKKLFFLLMLIIYACISNIYAQQSNLIGVQNEKGIIDTILYCFETNYVYPDVASKMKSAILKKYNNGDYKELKKLPDLLNVVASDLIEISGDKHIGINYVEKSDHRTAKNENSVLSESIEIKRERNFSFKTVKWLAGNIGYLRFDMFENAVDAGEKVSAAMNFLSDCNSLIIDLRYNVGGEENLVGFLASYFFSKQTLFNTLFFTKQDSLIQTWTNAYIPGKRFTDKDLFILTSRNTASGAEAFTYGLKTLANAIVVGENTSGAAHWVEYFYFPSLHLEIKLPVARPINPVTKTDWEGTGVTPDIIVPEYKAFETAYLKALERLLQKSDNEENKVELEWYMKIAGAKLENEIASLTDMINYIGEYGKVSILFKNNNLIWHQGENEEFALTLLTKDLFTFNSSDDYLIQFVRDVNEKVVGYKLLIKGQQNSQVREKTKSF